MNRKTPDGYRRLNPSYVLVAGPLSEVAEIIRSRRAELREQHGWIMDS
jgi:precorrin-6A synthase